MADRIFGWFSGACFALIAYYPNNPGGITSVMYSQPGGLPSVAVVSEILALPRSMLSEPRRA